MEGNTMRVILLPRMMASNERLCEQRTSPTFQDILCALIHTPNELRTLQEIKMRLQLH